MASVPLGACSTLSGTSTASTQETVTKAYATAEAAVTIAAQGLTKAVQMGGITPGSSTAKASQTALDAASKALDAANAYINAGLYDQAQTQINNANAGVAQVNAQTGTAS
jgi:hypothetical protein